MNDFDTIRQAMKESLSSNNPIILSSYGSNAPNISFGGIALVRNIDDIKVDRDDSFQFVATYASVRGNSSARPGWRPNVNYAAWIAYSPESSMKYDVVFRVNDPAFVDVLDQAMKEYERWDIITPVLRPFFTPIFMEPLSKALSSGGIELLLPDAEPQRTKAVEHLSI
jgi:hypothetical protein